jgi:hypothetical protein
MKPIGEFKLGEWIKFRGVLCQIVGKHKSEPNTEDKALLGFANAQNKFVQAWTTSNMNFIVGTQLHPFVKLHQYFYYASISELVEPGEG